MTTRIIRYQIIILKIWYDFSLIDDYCYWSYMSLVDGGRCNKLVVSPSPSPSSSELSWFEMRGVYQTNINMNYEINLSLFDLLLFLLLVIIMIKYNLLFLKLIIIWMRWWLVDLIFILITTSSDQILVGFFLSLENIPPILSLILLPTIS